LISPSTPFPRRLAMDTIDGYEARKAPRTPDEAVAELKEVELLSKITRSNKHMQAFREKGLGSSRSDGDVHWRSISADNVLSTWPAGPSDQRRDQVIYYQYRHDRARRTLRGIDQQIAKAERAVAGIAGRAFDLPPHPRLDRGTVDHRVRRSRHQSLDRGHHRLVDQEVRQDRPPLPRDQDPGRRTRPHRSRPPTGRPPHRRRTIKQRARGH
jgi:hypothetical protein